MKSSKSKTTLPVRVRRAIEKLGGDISVARRRRGISHKLMAERAFISASTLTRAEKGDPGVSMAVYASLLFVLDMTDRLAALADPAQDPVGMALEEERLPKRIRQPRGD
ncbi:MAG: helix-turn-helix domain-containing protein [Hyphomicrobiaceae bacterium]|jgi:transcriptional regulator with XRE-family HTH domain